MAKQRCVIILIVLVGHRCSIWTAVSVFNQLFFSLLHYYLPIVRRYISHMINHGWPPNSDKL